MGHLSSDEQNVLDIQCWRLAGWLELFARWDDENINVPYALVVTIEDMSGALDVYSEVQAQNRYHAINTLRLKVDA